MRISKLGWERDGGGLEWMDTSPSNNNLLGNGVFRWMV
jgi:hypothetical protein